MRIQGPGYGQSDAQLRLIRADALHDRGLYGLGVLIAHFDTGYPLLSHEVFRTLRIAGAHDFLDRDAAPWDPPANPADEMWHGQYTLSVLAGFKPGQLVGVAPGASYLLARTESSVAEVPSEEDHWIAALEWADSLGADIVTSSLRFLEFDDPWVGYGWEQMDGATTRVTRATDFAAQRGIVVFQGAGNEGSNDFHNTLVAPADGKEVIAVGAVGPQGARTNFSSVGPTTDFPARIKPDLMAPGLNVVAADVVHDSSYTRVSGTSLSTPLAAGVGALLLSVHAATPAQLRDALRLTASRASSPDNFMGWGIIDAEAAYQYLIRLYPSDRVGGIVVVRPVLRFPNPFTPSAAIACEMATSGPLTLRVYDAFGRRVRSLVDQEVPAGIRAIAWDGADDAGLPLSRGVYFVELRAPDSKAPGTAIVTRKLVLSP
jgi:subtilisin family serine protease